MYVTNTLYWRLLWRPEIASKAPLPGTMLLGLLGRAPKMSGETMGYITHSEGFISRENKTITTVKRCQNTQIIYFAACTAHYQ